MIDPVSVCVKMPSADMPLPAISPKRLPACVAEHVDVDHLVQPVALKKSTIPCVCPLLDPLQILSVIDPSAPLGVPLFAPTLTKLKNAGAFAPVRAVMTKPAPAWFPPFQTGTPKTLVSAITISGLAAPPIALTSVRVFVP